MPPQEKSDEQRQAELQMELASNVAQQAKYRKVSPERFLEIGLGWDNEDGIIESIRSGASDILKAVPPRGANESAAAYLPRLLKSVVSAPTPGVLLQKLAGKKLKELTDRLPAVNWELQTSEGKPPPEK